jgi:hypothetical protein
MKDLFNKEYPDNLTFEQAKAFCKQRRWFVYEGETEYNWCKHCNKYHPIAVEKMGIGIERYWSIQEFIDWVRKLIPHSI